MEFGMYKIVEIVGASNNSFEDAIQRAVFQAGKIPNNLKWFNVVEARGCLEDGLVTSYQAIIRVGFCIREEI